jgi:endonuclease/exonuclease/phosphatase family metal-dependent hydrolase
LRGFPGPRLLIGDLNMTPDAVRRWSRMRPLAVAPTFPADAPQRQLDHILTDDPRLRGGAVESDAMPISDHRPLVVDLECVSAPGGRP